MIERMVKTTVICRKEDQTATLKGIRKLGIMHIDQVLNPCSAEVIAVRQGLEKVDQSIFILSETVTSEEAKIYSKSNPKILTDFLIRTIDENNSLKKEIETKEKDLEKLLPWGNFSFASIEKLESKGIYVYLCSSGKEDIQKLTTKGIVEIISEGKGRYYFALISREKYKKDELPLDSLLTAKTSLNDLEWEIETINDMIQENKKLIDDLSANLGIIKEYKTKLEEALEFSINKETLGKEKNLVYITGYIPKKKEHLLISTARKDGWAVLLEKPKEGDVVPTCLNIPKTFRISKPIFDFLGISPGYKEWDISWCFLIFLGIFFALIIGDAGYGVIFLLVGVVLKIFLKSNKNAQLPLNLFIFFSILTIIWGSLTGTYFGVAEKALPKDMHGLEFLTNPETKNRNLQLICFLLAATHLSLARMWKALIMIRSIKALGQVGWALVIWGNFFTAVKLILFPDMIFPAFVFWLYGIGIGFIFVFYVHWNKPEAIFETPLSMIQSFVDVLSYIRLFAVGIAAVYIAENFNMMGKQVVDISHWFAILAFIILLAGHSLNIMLGLMAVLIHGIRLNALEFSNHMELKWTGIQYKPFKKRLFNLKKT